MRAHRNLLIFVSSSHKIFLCAGEASGDLHGANLMKSIAAQKAEVKFVGVGGTKMRDCGLSCWREAETLNVMGLWR